LSGDLRDKIILLATGWGDKRAATMSGFIMHRFSQPTARRGCANKKCAASASITISVGGAQEPRNGNTHAMLLGSGIWIVKNCAFPMK
jgi:kynurenine formamidase